MYSMSNIPVSFNFFIRNLLATSHLCSSLDHLVSIKNNRLVICCRLEWIIPCHGIAECQLHNSHCESQFCGWMSVDEFTFWRPMVLLNVSYIIYIILPWYCGRIVLYSPKDTMSFDNYERCPIHIKF